ncbi:MFS transporter [Terriglobus saanensis]|uniref:MFS family transporter n=1 Tax=Terriglobus saanensis (strain ATCC BAA-1853 / DSM 23119 / SP1PR4) TaxID=401053 RepID=E8UZY3_TERSS|nr:MFS transporter [Terriglobus saanensis]ADV81060.1 MFS family transporter [Terriglobus saanensis SP1PR4]
MRVKSENTIVPVIVPQNRPGHVLFASLVGTTVEFFDFYIYATAAVLVFPKLFFPASDPASATLASLATFGIAFLARPVGSALFGHFGDRIGRKTTLVIALSTMGLSTFAIGALPTYSTIGFAAPLLLALCRFGQGIGLGGEWGGAVLLAIENAPPNKRAWYGMFPQLGAPLGFFLSGGVFLLLSRLLTDQQFFRFGWRLPFLASALLVVLGLYVRLTIHETPVFQKAMDRHEQVKFPMLTVMRRHTRPLLAGILVCLATFVLFYLMTVFALSWGTTVLGFSRGKFLLMQMAVIPLFALTIPISALLAERGRRRVMLSVTVAIALFGLVMAKIFVAGTAGALAMMGIGLALMGMTYGPLGTVISELFPTPVRYTGSSLAFSFAGILGGSLAPYAATYLARSYGLPYVGYYLATAAALSLAGLLLVRETKDDDLAQATDAPRIE